MTEFELKLEIPDDRYPALAAELAGATAQRLQARYFDTPGAQLLAAGIVVRVRHEGGQWVQTAKAPAPASSGNASGLNRLEHNLDLPLPASNGSAGGNAGDGVDDSLPAVDLSCHAGTPLDAVIRAALGLGPDAPFPQLVAVFETDVQRLTRVVQAADSAIEIALDRGRVTAGKQHMPLCEVEFELKAGHPRQAALLARDWCARHGLWLSTVSKSEKGWQLAGQGRPGGAAGFELPPYSKKASAAQLLSAVLHACLNQIMPNASALAGGSAQNEHVHQLRVGLRRLRTALRELAPLCAHINAQWEGEIASAFAALGAHRDHSLINDVLQPQLVAAGGPALQFAGKPHASSPQQAARSAPLQRVLLEVLALALSLESAGDANPDTAIDPDMNPHTDANASPQHGPKRKVAKPQRAQHVIEARLQKLFRKVARCGSEFAALDEDAQHRVRKQLKRLRYLVEFSAPLFSARKVNAFIAQLKSVQDTLGLYNDELVALHHYREQAATNPHALFGLGWLSARRHANAQACMQGLQALAAHKRFWR